MTYVVVVVRTHTAEDAVERLIKLKRKRDPKKTEEIIKSKSSKSRGDIAELSTKMSLLDPILMIPIQIPVRFDNCKHIDCFDARNFLQMAYKKPSWKCPHCNNHFAYGTLRIDQWFQDLLNKVAKGTREIEIAPDGSFKVLDKDSDDDDDDSDDERLARASQKAKTEQPAITLDDSTSAETKKRPQT